MNTKPTTASHARLVEELGRRVTGGELAPGTIMTLAGLEAEYGASRTVLRETVRVLESHGLVSSRRHVGILVRPPEEWDSLNASVIEWTLDGAERHRKLIELTELRVAVEPVAARLAAEHADDDQRAELLRLAAELHERGARGEGASDEYLEVDIAYHSLLLRAGGNALFARLAAPVSEILRGRSVRGWTPAVPHDGTLEAHVATAQAIAHGDGAAAEASAREHVTLVADEVTSL